MTPLTAALAKPAPDLAAVAAIADSVQPATRRCATVCATSGSRLYGTFSPEQKAVVRDALLARVARMDAMRAKMQQRMGGS